MATLQHRLTIPGVGSSFAVGDPSPLPDTDFSVDSVRGSLRPFIAQRGEEDEAGPDLDMDGQRVDVLTGHVEEGEVQLRVIDEPGTIAGVACDINDVVIAEGSAGLHLDGTAFSSGKWTVVAVNHPLTSKPAADFGVNANGPILGTFALFGWLDAGSWVRETYVEATFDGTEGGGPGFTPGEKYGFRFRVNWTLDTGGGNVFVELEGAEGPIRVSAPTSGFDLWNIPSDPLNQQVDLTVYATADGSGEIIVRLGAENMFPSFNLTVQFTDIEVVQCDDVVVGVDAERYVTGWLADATARQQLKDKKAYLEESTDGGVTWSRLLYSGYVQSIVLEESLTYVFTLGDTRRVERVTEPWKDVNPLSGVIFEKMTALVGGPIYNGWAPLVRNYGLPVFRVVDQEAATLGNNGWVELQYRSGPLPPMWAQPSGGFRQRDTMRLFARNYINERAEEFHDATPSLTRDDTGTYPGLRATLLDPTAETATVENLTPMSLLPTVVTSPSGFPQVVGLERPILLSGQNTLRLRWSVTSTGTYPNGTDFKLLVTPRDVSAKWPLHVALHPVVITSALYDLIGEPWDITTAAAVKASIGDHIVAVLRLDDPTQTIQQLNEILFGRHQYGTRRNDAGEWEFFWYGKVDATPSADLSTAVLRAEGGPSFDHGSSPRVNQVVIRSQLFSEYREGDPGEPAYDNLVARDVPATFDLSPDGVTLDAATYGTQAQEYALPGYVGWVTDLSPLGLAQHGSHLAEAIFDRHGRGAVQNTLVALRDTDADLAKIGVDVIVSAEHLPAAHLGQSPTSQRMATSGLTRWARVVQRSEEGNGHPIVQVVDDSTGVAYGETFTQTVQPSVKADPLYFYDIALDGITQCQADNARIEVEVSLGAAVPTAGSKYTTLNAALFVDDMAAVVDPWTTTLGPFPRGQTVWFRMRAFLYGGAPGDWTAWCHVGGCVATPADSISNLRISNETNEGADLDWSYDESPQVGDVKVEIRDVTGGVIGSYSAVTGSPFAPGTESTTLTGYTSGKVYQVRLTLIDAMAVEYGAVLSGFFATTGGKISGLSVSSVTAADAKLAWTNTDATYPVLVEFRVSGATLWNVFTTLPATSNRIRLTGLLPVTDYEVQVSINGGDGAGGAALTDSFTTLAVSVQLEYPLISSPFEAWDPQTSLRMDGRFGVRLQANPNNYAVPHEIVVLLAVETSVGSGTPGTYVEQTPIAALAGVDLWFIADAPNDGKLRYMKALSRAAGYTDSIETVVVQADPWPDTGPTPPVGGGIPNTFTVSASALGSGAHSMGSFFLPDGAEIFRVESPLAKDIRGRLYIDSTVQASDASRAASSSLWPAGLLFDTTIEAADSYLIDIAPPQRVRVYPTQYESQVVWYTLTNLEAGTEDVTWTIYYFASPVGGVGGGTLP